MNDQLQSMKTDFLARLDGVQDAQGLEEIRIAFFGRQGQLVEMRNVLKDLAAEEKKAFGMALNEAKTEMDAAFEEVSERIASQEQAAQIEREWIDVSLPPLPSSQGGLHLTTQAIEEVVGIFRQLGFTRSRHPEIDWDWYAFESLNMPKTHPARDDWETFFIAEGDDVMTGEKGKVVLTPHTSNGQVREMEKGYLPIRMININKTYRRQSDISHAPMFHQFEGLMIDKGVTVTQLKGVFDFFVKRFFGPDRETRLRPHHFRFTEPSFELDISCDMCKGTGCRLCKEGWLELGGAGMVHPNVLRAGGIDPDVYSGFAFGWGVERTMMMKSGLNIGDIRLLYKNDLRFLRQF